ncbi:reticulon-like protein B13 [Lycium ferocissimum]|uniref:reticulon-like protein B13 n=1 Tax=Lycium ferocissimum TaxID=112874 RepID=UPI0028164F3D|nr:reticulon-like protein B13 [Lycium ferocissimum]
MQSTSTDSPPPSPTHELDNNSEPILQTSTDSPTPSPTSDVGNSTGIVRDVILWKRKSYSVGALLAATVIWLALEVYGLTFVTLGSWIAMFAIAFIFFWGNIHMLLGKEPLDMSRMYISDESALEAGTKLREWVEKSARLLFSVSAEREWFVFAGTVASLGLLSVLASHFDLLTLLYIGVLVELTLPVAYVRYEDRIKELGQRLRGRSHTYYSAVTERCHTYYSTVAERCRTYYNIMAERAKKMKSNLQEKKMKKTE